MPRSDGVDYLPVVGRHDRDVLRDRQIEAEVHLLVDLLAFIDVAAAVGELRLHLGIRELQERLLPQEVVGGLQAEIGQRLVVLAAQLAVDLQEARQQVARAAGIDLVHHLLEERVVDVQIARAKFLGKDFEPESRGLDSAPGFRAKKIGTVSAGRSQGNANSENRSCFRSRQGKAAERVRSRPARRLRSSSRRWFATDQLAAALIDVVLEVVDRQLGRRRDDFEFDLARCGRGPQIVGLRLDRTAWPCRPSAPA